VATLIDRSHAVLPDEDQADLASFRSAAVGAEVLDLEAWPLGHTVSPRFEVELAWVEEAATVAARGAADRGWGAVPRRALVRELVEGSVPQ
jgi:hypothetical protein